MDLCHTESSRMSFDHECHVKKIMRVISLIKNFIIARKGLGNFCKNNLIEYFVNY